MKFGYGSLCSAGPPGLAGAERTPRAARCPVSAVLLGESPPWSALGLAHGAGSLPAGGDVIGNQMGDKR